MTWATPTSRRLHARATQQREVLHQGSGQRQPRVELRRNVQGRLVVQGLPRGQPERTLPVRQARELRGRRRVAQLARIQRVAGHHRDEDTSKGIQKSTWSRGRDSDALVLFR